MRNRMKPSVLPKKLIWVPIILFCKIFILNYTLDVYYVKMGQISFFANFVTLRITLLCPHVLLW
jgi:hypothetical protein